MNPWTTLKSQAPFVLEVDAKAIVQFNERAHYRVRLETDLLPEPFVGLLDAPIVLLALNPGVSDGDFALHETPDFQQRVRACHRQDATPFPYYYLDPAIAGPGARWSARVLAAFIRDFGSQHVARNVVLLEYLPYHSRGFAHARLSLASQEFSFEQVRQSVRRGSAIFVTRGLKLWAAAIPELTGYSRLFRTNSVQNVAISAKNCPSGWDAALAGLRGTG